MLYIKWCIKESLHNPDLRGIIVSHVNPYNNNKAGNPLKSFLIESGRM